jgi:hypothetical protein
MDLVTLLIGAAFYLLFAVSIRRWAQHRGALELAVVLVFTSTAAIFAATMLNLVLPGLAQLVSPLTTILLVLQPALMLRLVGLIVRLPRWVLPAVFAGCAISIIGFYATNRSVPAVVFLVGYFLLTETMAAAILFAESRRRLGLPRLRLSAAAAASLLFGISIFIAGMASAARGSSRPAGCATGSTARSRSTSSGRSSGCRPAPSRGSCGRHSRPRRRTSSALGG